MVKGILKRRSTDSVASSSTHSSSSSNAGTHKRVSFDGAEPACVFEADEWDRSPAEVTLRLTYKDVVELRELNVCLVRTGPLMMERTPSRRPTRKRTTTPPRSTTPPRPESPTPAPEPRLSPTYQYQPFSSQSLPPLLEDASSSSDSPPPARRAHAASASDSYFTFHPEPPAHSPPGLPLRAPHLKGLPSPALPPPSPLLLTPSAPPSPKPRPLHTPSPPPQRLKPLPFPALTRRNSVPEELALDSAKGILVPAAAPAWKPLSVHANASSPALGAGEPRRSVRSLMGWELRRSSSASGRRGFGLVRKGSTSA